MTKIQIPALSVKNQCSACGMVFARMSTFDQHRYGPYSERKCRTPAEMIAKGYAQTQKGEWKRMDDGAFAQHLAKLMEN